MLKYISRTFIVACVIFFIFYIITFSIGMLLENIAIGFIATIILFVLLGYSYWHFADWYPKKIKELSDKKYNELKIKEDCSLFEQLYVKAYYDESVLILDKIIKDNKIKHVYSLDFTSSYNNNYILFTFNHKRHSVYYKIYEDKVVYYIDSPKKYDHLDGNKEYEKKEMINISINDYDNLELFFNELIPNIKENLKKIDKFEEDINIVNISPKTLEKIQDYKCYVKEIGLLLNVISILLLLFMGWLTCWSIKEPEDNIFLYIIEVIFDGFVIFAYILSLCEIRRSIILDKDIKNQMVDSIKGKPYKIKFITEDIRGKGRQTKFNSGIKLYFNDNGKNIRLILAQYFNYINKDDKKKLINEFMKKDLELKYYINSKVIVSGAEALVKKMNDIEAM